MLQFPFTDEKRDKMAISAITNGLKWAATGITEAGEMCENSIFPLSPKNIFTPAKKRQIIQIQQ